MSELNIKFLGNNYYENGSIVQSSTEQAEVSIFSDKYKDKNGDNVVNEDDFKDYEGNVDKGLLKLLEINQFLNKSWEEVGEAINKLLGNINFLESYTGKYTRKNVQYRSDGTIEKMVMVYPKSGDILEQTYDETGKHVIHEVLIDKDGKVVCTKDFKYRSDGTKEKEISTTSDGIRQEDIYDMNGKKVIKSAMYKNGKYDSTYTYQYKKNGMFHSRTTKDKDGNVSSDYYDNNGNIIQTVWNVDGTKYDTKYRKDGTEKSCIITQSDGSSEEETYDSTGENVIKKIKKDKNGTYEAYYDNSGKKLLKEISKTSDGKTTTTEYTYHADGSLKTKVTKDSNGTTEITYADDGMTEIKKVSKNKSGNVTNYFEKILRPDGTLQKEITKDSNGTTEITYAADGKTEIKKVIKNKSGNVTDYFEKILRPDGTTDKTIKKNRNGTNVVLYDKAGNIIESESVEQINNKYYKGDKKYRKIVTNYRVFIETLDKNDKVTEKIMIDLDELLKPFNAEERKKIIASFREMPAEALIDLHNEVTFSDSTIGKGSDGEYSSTDKVSLRGGSMSAETITHELGHALDYTYTLGIFNTPQSSGVFGKFRSTFYDELEKFEQDGHKRANVERSLFSKDIEAESYDKDLGSTYATVSPEEAFAECYTLLMLGHCNSENTIKKYFKKTLQCAMDIIKYARNTSGLVRHR